MNQYRVPQRIKIQDSDLDSHSNKKCSDRERVDGSENSDSEKSSEESRTESNDESSSKKSNSDDESGKKFNKKEKISNEYSNRPSNSNKFDDTLDDRKQIYQTQTSKENVTLNVKLNKTKSNITKIESKKISLLKPVKKKNKNYIVEAYEIYLAKPADNEEDENDEWFKTKMMKKFTELNEILRIIKQSNGPRLESALTKLERMKDEVRLSGLYHHHEVSKSLTKNVVLKTKNDVRRSKSSTSLASNSSDLSATSSSREYNNSNRITSCKEISRNSSSSSNDLRPSSALMCSRNSQQRINSNTPEKETTKTLKAYLKELKNEKLTHFKDKEVHPDVFKYVLKMDKKIAAIRKEDEEILKKKTEKRKQDECNYEKLCADRREKAILWIKERHEIEKTQTIKQRKIKKREEAEKLKKQEEIREYKAQFRINRSSLKQKPILNIRSKLRESISDSDESNNINESQPKRINDYGNNEQYDNYEYYSLNTLEKMNEQMRKKPREDDVCQIFEAGNRNQDKMLNKSIDDIKNDDNDDYERLPSRNYKSNKISKENELEKSEEFDKNPKAYIKEQNIIDEYDNENVTKYKSQKIIEQEIFQGKQKSSFTKNRLDENYNEINANKELSEQLLKREKTFDKSSKVLNDQTLTKLKSSNMDSNEYSTSSKEVDQQLTKTVYETDNNADDPIHINDLEYKLKNPDSSTKAYQYKRVIIHGNEDDENNENKTLREGEKSHSFSHGISRQAIDHNSIAQREKQEIEKFLNQESNLQKISVKNPEILGIHNGRPKTSRYR